MKQMILTAALLLAGGAAVADYTYLYWEVDPTGVTGDWAWWLTEGRAFDYAQLRAVDQGGTVIGGPIRNYDATLQPVGGATDVWSAYPSPALVTDTPVFGDITDYASELYGFVVEAYLEDGGLLWTSGVSWYEDLLAGRHVWKGDPSAMAGDILAKTFMVPEPSSGLLFLLGLAGLALRRKRERIERQI